MTSAILRWQAGGEIAKRRLLCLNSMKHSPGIVRDAIITYLRDKDGDASVSEIKSAVESKIGDVPASSVRSSLRLRPDMFKRTGWGRYQLKRKIG